MILGGFLFFRGWVGERLVQIGLLTSIVLDSKRNDYSIFM